MRVLPKIVLIVGFLIFALATALFGWAPGRTLPVGRTDAPIEMAPLSQEKPKSASGRPLRVLTWNIAYGYGLGSEGDERYVPYSAEKIRATLERMAGLIRELDPDIVQLQEVDFDSARSRFIDEAFFLAENTELKFFSKAIAWRANYVPFPYLPFSRHFGRMLSGGAVLSRYPIRGAEVEILPKPAGNPWWYNLFYLNRYFQRIEVDVGGRSIAFFNLHLDAYDSATRNEQAKMLVERAVSDRVVSDRKTYWLAGDFNSPPELAKKKSGFSGDSQDRYELDRVHSILSGSGLQSGLNSAEYLAGEANWATFPSDAPDRMLDHVYVTPNARVSAFRRVDEAKTLSDHLPLLVDIELVDEKTAK